eukprot:SAG11_NODE_18562_length_487_cov_1.329897_2_plen_36_part_01
MPVVIQLMIVVLQINWHGKDFHPHAAYIGSLLGTGS